MKGGKTTDKKSHRKFDILFFCVQLSIPILLFKSKKMIKKMVKRSQEDQDYRDDLAHDLKDLRAY
ncbi:hypothetical protein J6T66_00240 [bacterium]|nr:hypothetical protein [bacterium]